MICQWLCNGIVTVSQLYFTGITLIFSWLCNCLFMVLQWYCNGFAMPGSWLFNSMLMALHGMFMVSQLYFNDSFANLFLMYLQLYVLGFTMVF